MTSSQSTPSPFDRLARWVPALGVARTYTLVDGRADLLAGISVAAVAVPQAMAYALIVGLPPEYGLYTAIVMTAVGALFDSSRQLINGPTNAISIALLSVLATADSSEQKVQLAVTMAFLIGAFQLGITLMRLGDLTRYISHSVIVGFMAGASLLLVLDQTKNLLGLTASGDPHDHFLVRFGATLLNGGAVHWLTLVTGVGTMGLVLLLRLGKKRFAVPLLPEMLIAIVAMATLSWAFDLSGMGVKVIGEIPAKLPSFDAPHLPYWRIRNLASGALAIALLGLLEAIAMAKGIAAVTRQKLDLNQQCLSEGLANVVGSFFQCMPGSGSLTRSAINQQAGARTQWSGVVSAVAVALIVVAFAPYARFIPRSALAGILVLTAGKMVNIPELRRHLRTSRFDAVIVLATAFSAFAISIEFCVLIGVFTSFVLTVPRVGKMVLVEFVVTGDGHVQERLEGDEVCGHILIFGLEGEMFFGAADSLEARLAQIETRIAKETRVVVLRMKRTNNPDVVGMGALERFVDRVQGRGVVLLMCGVRKELRGVLVRTGLIKKLNPENVFIEQPVRKTSTILAIQHAATLVSDPCPVCVASSAGIAQQPLYMAP